MSLFSRRELLEAHTRVMIVMKRLASPQGTELQKYFSFPYGNGWSKLLTLFPPLSDLKALTGLIFQFVEFSLLAVHPEKKYCDE